MHRAARFVLLTGLFTYFSGQGPHAAAQVVIRERVEVLAETGGPDSSESLRGQEGRLPGLSEARLGPPGPADPRFTYDAATGAFTVEGGGGRLWLALTAAFYRGGSPPADAAVLVSVEREGVLEQTTAPITAGQFATSWVQYESMSEYGCIPESDADYISMFNTADAGQCAVIEQYPGDALFDLGDVAVGDRVTVMFQQYGQEHRSLDGTPYMTWCPTEQRSFLYIEHYESPCYSHPYGRAYGYLVLEGSAPDAEALHVTVAPDTLRLGEAAVLSAEGRDAGGNTAPLPDGATLDLSLGAEDGVPGYLRRSDTGAEGAVLLDVPLSVIEAGMVEVVVGEQLPTVVRDSGARSRGAGHGRAAPHRGTGVAGKGPPPPRARATSRSAR